MDPIAVACWNSRLPYKKENIKLVAKNDNTLQFITGIKVEGNLFKNQKLWTLSNRLQVIFQKSLYVFMLI